MQFKLREIKLEIEQTFKKQLNAIVQKVEAQKKGSGHISILFVKSKLPHMLF